MQTWQKHLLRNSLPLTFLIPPPATQLSLALLGPEQVRTGLDPKEFQGEAVVVVYKAFVPPSVLKILCT